jgi:DNA-binding NarL/FixJ family response regulator
MITENIKQLEAARAKVAELEKTVADQMQAELAALPAKYGFADLKGFIAALKKAATGGRAGGAKRAAKVKVPREPGARRPRSVITDETRAELKRLVEEGKSGPEIVAALGISLPSVQNIKKALGLVKPAKG